MNRYLAETGLLLHSPKEGKKQSLYSWCVPYSFLGSNHLGHFFGIVEIYLSNNFWANAEVFKVIASFSEKSSQYFQPDLDPEKNLENLLAQLNTEIENLITEKSLPLESEKINALLGILEDNNLAFTPVGEINAYLVHHVKKHENVIVNILEKTPGSAGRAYPLKMFGNIVTGKLSSLDSLFFCNENVLNYLSLNKIQQIITDYATSETINYLQTTLIEVNPRSDFAVLIFKLQKIAEHASILPKVTPTTTPRIDLNQAINIPTTAISSQQSMARLIFTQESTNKILSPSLKPELKKYAALGKQWLVTGWQKIKQFNQDSQQQIGKTAYYYYQQATKKIKSSSAAKITTVKEEFKPWSKKIAAAGQNKKMAPIVNQVATPTLANQSISEPKLPPTTEIDDSLDGRLAAPAPLSVAQTPLPLPATNWFSGISKFIKPEVKKLLGQTNKYRQLAGTYCWQLSKNFYLFSRNVFWSIVKSVANKLKIKDLAWQKFNSLLNRLFDRLTKIPRHSQKIFYYFLLILFILLQSLVWQGNFSQTQKNSDLFNATVVLIQDKLGETESRLAADDEPGAKQSLWLAQTTLASLQVSSRAQQKLWQQIQKDWQITQAKTLHLMTITNPEIVVDLKNLGTVSSFTKLGSMIYLFSEKDHGLYQLNLSSSQLKLLLTDSRLANIKNFKPLSEKLLYLQTNQELLEYDIQKNSLAILNLTPSPSAELADFEFFNQKLYLLLANQGQIIKYNRGASGFINGQLSLNNKRNLATATALAIDNIVYLLTTEGNIFKVSGGRLTKLDLANISPPITSGRQIITKVDWTWLYLIEHQSNRLLVLHKDGKLKIQYQLPTLTNLGETVIAPTEKAAYFLQGQALYRFNLIE